MIKQTFEVTKTLADCYKKRMADAGEFCKSCFNGKQMATIWCYAPEGGNTNQPFATTFTLY